MEWGSDLLVKADLNQNKKGGQHENSYVNYDARVGEMTLCYMGS